MRCYVLFFPFKEVFLFLNGLFKVQFMLILISAISFLTVLMLVEIDVDLSCHLHLAFNVECKLHLMPFISASD